MWRTEWGRALWGGQRYASCMDCFLYLCVLTTEGSAQQLSKACVPPWAGLGAGTITDKYLSSEPGSWRTWQQQKQRSRLLWPRAGQRHWLGPLSMRLMDHRHQVGRCSGRIQSYCFLFKINKQTLGAGEMAQSAVNRACCSCRGPSFIDSQHSCGNSQPSIYNSISGNPMLPS